MPAPLNLPPEKIAAIRSGLVAGKSIRTVAHEQSISRWMVDQISLKLKAERCQPLARGVSTLPPLPSLLGL